MISQACHSDCCLGLSYHRQTRSILFLILFRLRYYRLMYENNFCIKHYELSKYYRTTVCFWFSESVSQNFHCSRALLVTKFHCYFKKISFLIKLAFFKIKSKSVTVIYITIFFCLIRLFMAENRIAKILDVLPAPVFWVFISNATVFDKHTCSLNLLLDKKCYCLAEVYRIKRVT